MKKNIFYLTALLFVFGCSNESDVSEPAEVAEPQTVLAEYMWCDFGPNTSPETLDALAADFREITENSENKVVSAWGYIPSFETDLYDAVWLNVWASAEEREAGWADWLANNAEDFEAKHNDTLNCQEDRVFQFNAVAGMQPGVEWSDEPPFNADYHFCTYNEGNGDAELEPIMASFDSWVAGREKDSMWYAWHKPLFDTSNINGSVVNGYDYMIAFYWQNNDEREAGYSAYGETDLQSQFDSIESCEIRAFEGYPIVEPSS
jgi:hypothetical protein